MEITRTEFICIKGYVNQRVSRLCRVVADMPISKQPYIKRASTCPTIAEDKPFRYLITN